MSLDLRPKDGKEIMKMMDIPAGVELSGIPDKISKL